MTVAVFSLLLLLLIFKKSRVTYLNTWSWAAGTRSFLSRNSSDNQFDHLLNWRSRPSWVQLYFFRQDRAREEIIVTQWLVQETIKAIKTLISLVIVEDACRQLWMHVIVMRRRRVEVSAFRKPASSPQERESLMFWEMKGGSVGLYQAHPVLWTTRSLWSLEPMRTAA